MTKPKPHPKDNAVLVRRDPDGKVFSEIRDRNAQDRGRYLGNAVVIDRQKGNGKTEDTVISRAQTLAALLGLPYDEDLRQQCRAEMGWVGICNCERCIENRNKRAKKTQK